MIASALLIFRSGPRNRILLLTLYFAARRRCLSELALPATIRKGGLSDVF